MTAAEVVVDRAVEAEQVAIGALIQAAPGIQVAALSELRNDDVTDLWCRLALRTVRQMIADGVPVDAVTLHQYVVRHGLLEDAQLRGSFALWVADRTTTSAVPAPGHCLWYCLAVVEQSCRRRIVEAAENVARVAGVGSVADVAVVIGVEMTAMTTVLRRLREVLVDA